MNARLGWAVVVVSVWAPTQKGVAEELVEPGKTAAPSSEATPATERHRVNLGMSMPLGGGVGTGDVGLLGAMPNATAGYEVRMAGPAWFLVALRGGLQGVTSESATGEIVNLQSSWSAGGSIGVRLEAPVHEYVDVGGYGRFGGAAGQLFDSSAWQLGAVIGAGLHFRPTRLFGIRLGLDVLDWGYQEQGTGSEKVSGVFAHLKASPGLDLTFTL